MSETAPETISGRPIVGDHGATLCHRGIFTVDGGLPAQTHQPTMAFRPLGGRVWSATEGIYRTIFLEGDTGVICFDTFYSPGAAIAYRKAIARVFPRKPIHTIVYSHDHLDHTGYALDLAPRAEVIAHRECADVVHHRASDGQARATEVWEGEHAEYEIDGVRFELVNPGSTHGNGNVAAWVEDQRLLFMVDTVAAGVGYTFLPDWHIDSYVPVMRRLEALDFDVFVPGHFWPLDRAEFRDNLEYFEFVVGAGEQALRDGVDPDDYAEILAYADDRYGRSHGRLFRYDEYFAMNLMRAMLHALTGGWGLEDGAAASPAPRVPAAAPAQGDGAAATPASRLPAAAPARLRGGLGRPPVAPGSSGVTGELALDVQALAPGLWTAADAHARTVFAQGDGGVVAFNTLGSADAARAYRRAIEAVAPGAPIVAVVLSVDHADQGGFASDLAPEAEVVAHELCARVLAGRGRPAPDRVVRGAGEALELAGVAVELHHPSPTVGSGNLACRFPEHDALFVIGPRADARYGLFADWHVEHYARGMRSLLALEFATLVPGRGALMDRAGLTRAIAYFESLQWATQKAFAEGIAVWDLRAMEEYVIEVLREEYHDLDGFERHVGIGAMRVVHHYLMGGWGLEDTRGAETLLGTGAAAP